MATGWLELDGVLALDLSLDAESFGVCTFYNYCWVVNCD